MGSADIPASRYLGCVASLADDAQRGRRRRPRGLLPLAAVAAIVAAIALLPAVLPSLNPFREETIDRSGPVLRRSLENLSEYRAASANLQVVVDVERDASLLPDFIKGERTLFLAAGTVDAAVDFGALDERAIRVSDDRKAATITLPPPYLTPARLDTARSRVYDRDRGVIDRLGEALSDDGGADQQDIYRLAEEKLREAAAEDPELLRTAERNTRAMLTGMLRGLGYEQITIRFRRPPV
jgi:Protein of unknown function (DUF4230)